jgi:hypothetical protein
MLKGSLAQVSLTEVIRLLSSSQQTGLLHIMNTSDTVATGGCYFQFGKLVHATMGRFSGLDAVNEICRINEGTFAFETSVTAPVQSLAAYPTATLIEMIHEQLEENRALAEAAPDPGDVLRYLPGKSVDGLEATPEELSVLLLCSGQRTVAEIAPLTEMTPVVLRTTLAKFRRLGLLEIVADANSGAVPPPAEAVPVVPPSPAPVAPQSAVPAEATEPRVVRYWRGKPVYE